MVIFLRDLCHYLATKLFNDLLNCILVLCLHSYSVCKQKFMFSLTACYRGINGAVYPEHYQVQLTVVGFTAAHSGIYTVTIKNREDMITEQFERRVEGWLIQCLIWYMYNVFTDTEPAVVTSLTGTGTGRKCIVLGIDSMLTCTYTGVPTVTPLWYKDTGDGKMEIRESNAEYVVDETSTPQTTILTIRNVADDDAGKYGCQASNSVNGTTSSHHIEVDFVICSK